MVTTIDENESPQKRPYLERENRALRSENADLYRRLEEAILWLRVIILCNALTATLALAILFLD